MIAIKVLIVIFIVLITSSAYSIEKYDFAEKILVGSYLTTQVIDTLQTKSILKSNGEFKELNPLITNSNELYVVKGVTVATVLCASHFSKHKTRKAYLIIANAVGFFCIVKNKRLGVKINF